MIEAKYKGMKGEDFSAAFEEIKSKLKARLPDVSEQIRSKFVAVALTTRGTNSLGQVTGNLSRALAVHPVDVADFGGLEIFVPQGILPHVYGQRWESERFHWFTYGFNQVTAPEFIEPVLQEALDKSIAEVQK